MTRTDWQAGGRQGARGGLGLLTKLELMAGLMQTNEQDGRRQDRIPLSWTLYGNHEDIEQLFYGTCVQANKE